MPIRGRTLNLPAESGKEGSASLPVVIKLAQVNSRKVTPCRMSACMPAWLWLRRSSPRRLRRKDNDYCLSCRGPDQTYLCRVTGAPPRSDALKLYCVIRAAKEGGHSSCAARNDASDCPGILKEYAYVAPDLSSGFAVREETPSVPPAAPATAGGRPTRTEDSGRRDRRRPGAASAGRSARTTSRRRMRCPSPPPRRSCRNFLPALLLPTRLPKGRSPRRTFPVRRRRAVISRARHLDVA